MKHMFHSIVLTMLFLFLLPVSSRAEQLLIPAGTIVGLQLQDDSVTVAAFDELLGGNARDAGLQIGDEILEIDGSVIDSAEDVRSALKTGCEEIILTVSREGKTRTVHMQPRETDRGRKLGVYLRQGITGIGTVTWYDPDTGRFGTLGHGVSSRRGELLPMSSGNLYNAEIFSVVRGKSGTPGQLKGQALSETPCGRLLQNTPRGVFGETRQGWLGEPVPVACFEQVRPGPAMIRSTVTGRVPEEYSVEILKIYPKDRHDSRNFLLKVTDSRLLEQTGGIVQGMSGSPIIQDGRLVGAITHVMVSDPTTGYGIFIGNMLDAAA